MTTEQLLAAFEAENPDAYKAIFNAGAESSKAAAREEGAAQERVRLTAIAGEQTLTHEGYIAAFGDKGARAFLEKKPFATMAAEQMSELKAGHDAAIKAKDAEIEALNTKLAAMPRGNDAASYQAEPKPEAGKAGVKKAERPRKYSDGAELGDGLGYERFAAGIKLPTEKAVATN